jgi:hypothetical protein
MRTTPGKGGKAGVRPVVEQLEGRQLLSVTVLPHSINLRGAQHGNGVFTVKIISDTPAAADLLKAASLTFTVGTVTLTPVKSHTVELNGDNVPDLVLKFRRSTLSGLTAGQQTLTVTAGGTSSTTSEDGTFNLFEPGHGSHSHSHSHGHGHGH